jgi:hypothetical protein
LKQECLTDPKLGEVIARVDRYRFLQFRERLSKAPM